MKRPLAMVVVAVLAACAGTKSGVYVLPDAEAEQYETAHIAEVVAAPEGDDHAEGAGEHVVVRSNFDRRTDMGGWAIEDADGNRLPLGIGRQLDPGAELRVYSSCGEDSEEAVFACLNEPVLDDDGDVVRLLDAGGAEVARFAYGDASGG